MKMSAAIAGLSACCVRAFHLDVEESNQRITLCVMHVVIRFTGLPFHLAYVTQARTAKITLTNYYILVATIIVPVSLVNISVAYVFQ